MLRQPAVVKVSVVQNRFHAATDYDGPLKRFLRDTIVLTGTDDGQRMREEGLGQHRTSEDLGRASSRDKEKYTSVMHEFKQLPEA